MKPDPWVKERNVLIVKQFRQLRLVGSPFKEAIEILAREYHLGFSTVKNMINLANKEANLEAV